MTGLDTNVLVRYLTQDDPAQAAVATRFIETRLGDREPGFISLVVLVELCWVLQKIYGATDAELAETVTDLLASARFVVQHREAVRDGVAAFAAAAQGKAGLPDHLIASIAAHEGCGKTVSFDRGAIGAAGMVAVEKA